jgi:hypothetical protein
MSLEFKETRLSGFQGPFWFSLYKTTQFARALGSQWGDVTALLALGTRCRQVPQFVGWKSITTDDGYEWLCGLYFRYGLLRKGTVVLAVPHANDRNRQDGVPFDRRPVAYLAGAATTQHAERALDAVIAALRRRS